MRQHHWQWTRLVAILAFHWIFFIYCIHPLQNVCLLALGSDNIHHKTVIVPFVKDHHCVQWKLHMVQTLKLKKYNVINVSCIIEMAWMLTLFSLVLTVESMAIPLWWPYQIIILTCHGDWMPIVNGIFCPLNSPPTSTLVF